MKTLQVDFQERSYPIHIGTELLKQSGELLARVYKEKRIAVLTDEVVWTLYGSQLDHSLRQAGFSPEWIRVPQGEESKSMLVFERVLEELAAIGLRRDEMIVAFGGGVIGDLGGFAAASYMRGVRYVQIPTTLLSQVDSSVGGKTGLNLSHGKNLVGAFWQPSMVITDTELLKTLDDRQFACGMAEVVKYGAIKSISLFDSLVGRNRDSIQEAMVETVFRCCDIKRAIVQQDERDKGERMLLNFGHTFGHAIERAGDYKTHTHGEAVAIGMVMAANAGEALGITEKRTAERLASLLKGFGLPTCCEYDMFTLDSFIKNDKKADAEGLRYVLLEDIGCGIVYSPDREEMEAIKQSGERK